MQRRKGLWSLAIAVALVALGATAPFSAADGARAEGIYIVVYRDGIAHPGAETSSQAKRLGFDVDYRYRAALEGYAAELSADQLEAVRADPDVAFVGEDAVAEAAGVVPLAPGEPRPPTGVRRIRTATSTTTREASTSNVAVLDTGIKVSHPDLNAVGGTDCYDLGTPPHDGNGHGTHMAGTIGALNNGTGVVGVAPGTKVFGVRVLGDAGHGSVVDIICGIDWVTANHVRRNIDVANMSLVVIESIDPTQPCATTTSPLHKAICNSTAAGVSYVAAAGNDSHVFDDPTYAYAPAAYPEVLAVTSVSDFDGRPGALTSPTCTPWGSDDGHSVFSNHAAAGRAEFHTIAAPGDCINSTWNRPPFYYVGSGTSSAAAHVAGLIALCMGEVGSGPAPCGGKTPAQVIAIMRNRAAAYAAAHPGAGFWGDPDDSLWPQYYGYLAHALPPAPPAP